MQQSTQQTKESTKTQDKNYNKIIQTYWFSITYITNIQIAYILHIAINTVHKYMLIS